MDPLRLLTRSSKHSHNNNNKPARRDTLPSTGGASNPQLYGADGSPDSQSRKRKRGTESAFVGKAQDAALNFFGGQTAQASKASGNTFVDVEDVTGTDEFAPGSSGEPKLSEEECRAILKRHKLKITLLNANATAAAQQGPEPDKKKKKAKDRVQDVKTAPQSSTSPMYPQPVTDFQQLRLVHGVSKTLARNIDEQGYRVPTEVQMSSLPLLLGSKEEGALDGARSENLAHGHIDLLTVAPTGSGKTLAFLVPLIQALGGQRGKNLGNAASPGPRAIILAPTKELANQIVNEGRKLASHTGVQLTAVRKGMVIAHSKTAKGSESETEVPPVKSDILVSTPMTLLNALGDSQGARYELPDIQHLILDEADVLLDALFRDQTLPVWNALSNPQLRVSLWSATMGSNIEELAKSVIEQRANAMRASTGQEINRAPLIRLVVGLKDSAVPNISHQMTYAATEQGKLMALRQLLHPSTTDTSGRPQLRAPFLVFTQTIERAVALHSELLYDIPPEAGGISRIAVLHSDLSDTARDKVMTRFRQGEIWVLITTDLLSRGVDFRGVNGVVNYDVPNSSAAYVHRVGRTGRAGRQGGVAVTLYTKEDIPYVKNVANIIAASQKQQGLSGAGQGGVQQWLLDALPDVSKKDKQLLKKRGVEARRSGKGTTKTRISTKSGFERRLENNRRGAREGGRREKEQGLEAADGGESGGDSDFGGFD